MVSLFATYQTAPQGLMTYAARGVDSLEGILVRLVGSNAPSLEKIASEGLARFAYISGSTEKGSTNNKKVIAQFGGIEALIKLGACGIRPVIRPKTGSWA